MRGNLVALFVLFAAAFAGASRAVSEPALVEAAESEQFREAVQWGTYRPGLWFGVRQRAAVSPCVGEREGGAPASHSQKRPSIPFCSIMTGIAWTAGEFEPSSQQMAPGVRHEARVGEGVGRWGYSHHDGRTVAVQSIADERHGATLRTEALFDGDAWHQRIRIELAADAAAPMAFIAYVATETVGERLSLEMDRSTNVSAVGDNVRVWADGAGQQPRFWGAQVSQPWTAGRAIEAVFRRQTERAVAGWVERNKGRGRAEREPVPVVPMALGNTQEKAAQNVVALQWTLSPGSTADVHLVYRGHDAAFPDFGAELETRKAAFETRFEHTFGLEQAYGEDEVGMARAALANMLGGVAFLHGNAVVGGEMTPMPHSLFTAVPSRSFFPRGFMWDEGFHQVLVGAWDADLSRSILAHWLSLMDGEGWIAREQILGPEGRSRVPEDFWSQERGFANPPTLFLALLDLFKRDQQTIRGMDEVASFVEDHETDANRLGEFWRRAYQLMKRQYRFYERTQRGNGTEAEGFQWQGRTANHTLTSGLDDYPRSLDRTGDERHVDMHCWMALMEKTLASIARSVGEVQDAHTFSVLARKRVAELDALHWTGSQYADWAGGDFVLHTGYVSAFPALLGVLPSDHPHLGPLLRAIESRLLVPCGLASLAPDDEAFGTGEDYWRGACWMNMNYLALRSLREYSSIEGENRDLAASLFDTLRRTVVTNMARDWTERGFLYEQYAPDTGRGRKSHPFTG